MKDREAGLDVLCCKQARRRTGTLTRWCTGQMNVSAVLTKDEGGAADLWRAMCRSSECTLASEDELLMKKQEEKERRQDLALR